MDELIKLLADLSNAEKLTAIAMMGAGIAAVIAAGWAIFKHFSKRSPAPSTRASMISTTAVTIQHSPSAPPVTAAAPQGSAPLVPSLFIGREDDIRELKARLGITGKPKTDRSLQVLTAVRGLPGVGKTTLVSALAHDNDVIAAFPDGVLWTSVGQTPDIFSGLDAWGRAIGIDDLLQSKSIEEASSRLRAVLLNQRRLLIVDDVWDPVDAEPFKIGGRYCATLITTRETQTAEVVASSPKDVYPLGVLTDEKALELLQELAHSIVIDYPQESLELVHELEGLPLALQVAGRLLNKEASRGFDVPALLVELRDGVKLLEARAPADRVDLASQTIPTVAVLLETSTDRLSAEVRDRFACLAPFAPKPATFNVDDMKDVWGIDDAKPTVTELVDRGLLERLESGRFWMHALLVMHAESLLTD